MKEQLEERAIEFIDLKGWGCYSLIQSLPRMYQALVASAALKIKYIHI